MLDLFKKEEINFLKARIAELEEENRKLSLQLEKREEIAKKIIAAKQEADRELNEARSKISSLENEIQKLKKEAFPEINFRFSESLSGHRFEEILTLLGSLQSKTSTLVTIYLPANETLKNADVLELMDGKALHLIDKIESSTGKAVFYDTNNIIKLVILPVFPISKPEYTIGRQFNIEPLRNSLKNDKTLVLNAHAGETLIGIIEAGTFIEHAIIRSSVMGKHSKGGWSQKRFQSLVEEDVKHHADKVRAALVPMIEKHKDIQYIIAGGEGKLVRMILEGYDYPLVTKSMDAIRKGNTEQVLRDVMAARWYGI